MPGFLPNAFESVLHCPRLCSLSLWKFSLASREVDFLDGVCGLWRRRSLWEALTTPFRIRFSLGLMNLVLLPHLARWKVLRFWAIQIQMTRSFVAGGKSSFRTQMILQRSNDHSWCTFGYLTPSPAIEVWPAVTCDIKVSSAEICLIDFRDATLQKFQWLICEAAMQGSLQTARSRISSDTDAEGGVGLDFFCQDRQ